MGLTALARQNRRLGREKSYEVDATYRYKRYTNSLAYFCNYMINCLGKVYVLRFLSDRRLAKTRDPDKVEETEAAIAPASATQPPPSPAGPRAPASAQRGQGHRGRPLPRRVHRAHPAAHPPALAHPHAPRLGQGRHLLPQLVPAECARRKSRGPSEKKNDLLISIFEFEVTEPS